MLVLPLAVIVRKESHRTGRSGRDLQRADQAEFVVVIVGGAPDNVGAEGVCSPIGVDTHPKVEGIRIATGQGGIGIFIT